jgi:hypothetical protein
VPWGSTASTENIGGAVAAAAAPQAKNPRGKIVADPLLSRLTEETAENGSSRGGPAGVTMVLVTRAAARQLSWWREPVKEQGLAYVAAWLRWTLDAFDFTVFLLIMVPIANEFQVPYLQFYRRIFWFSRLLCTLLWALLATPLQQPRSAI